MKSFEDYLGYGVAFGNHPLRFYASMAQATINLNKQYIDACKRYCEISEKEFALIANSNGFDDFLSRQKEIFDEAVHSTGDVVNQAVDSLKDTSRPIDSLVAKSLQEKAEKRTRTAPRSTKTNRTKAA